MEENIFLRFFKDFIYLFFREGMEGRDTMMLERNIGHLTLTHSLAGGGTYNPGMCPDPESNQRLSLAGMMPNQLSHIGHSL